jgi:hypothetical protein
VHQKSGECSLGSGGSGQFALAKEKAPRKDLHNSVRPDALGAAPKVGLKYSLPRRGIELQGVYDPSIKCIWANRRNYMAITVRTVMTMAAAIVVLAASAWMPVPAYAQNKQQRLSVQYMARSYGRFRTYRSAPDSGYFFWRYGPSIEWYLISGYPGPYMYYWDCRLRPRVVGMRQGRKVVRNTRVCNW